MVTEVDEVTEMVLSVKVALVVMLFFFSSRRRHTRFDCDWSSDVCSSDLQLHRRYVFDRSFHSRQHRQKFAPHAASVSEPTRLRFRHQPGDPSGGCFHGSASTAVPLVPNCPAFGQMSALG